MIGPVALHGGGEFLAGDEPFLTVLLESASRRVGARVIRIALVPTAAARGRPDLAGSHGVAAFERIAAAVGVEIEARVIAIVDTRSTADPGLAAWLAAADIVHLPGGDPDLIPTILGGTPAWEAIRTAWSGGAVIAGASAGAMALASWTWTPGGGVRGLGLVPGLVVVPHADADGWASRLERFRAMAPPGLGFLGLAEQTGAISDDVEADPVRWRVVGPGEVRWGAGASRPAVVARTGAIIETPAFTSS